MKIGVCGGYDRIEIASECGFDYIEANFSSLTRCNEEEFFRFNDKLIKCGIACEAANSFLPGEMKITGCDVDYKALEDYLKIGYKRAEELLTEHIEKLHEVAKRLLEKEKIDGEEFNSIFE